MKSIKSTIVFITLLVALVFGLVIPVSADAVPSCQQVGNGQWHIVNAEGGNVFFATEAECLAALEELPTPTDEPTAIPTDEPTTVPTDEPTAIPTDEPTQVPTVIVTVQPTTTPEPTSTPIPVDPTLVPTTAQRTASCLQAYTIFTTQVHWDVGYQIVRNHPWCRVWMVLKYGYIVP